MICPAKTRLDKIIPRPKLNRTRTTRGIDETLEDIASQGAGLLTELKNFGLGLLRPWSLYQIGILIALFCAAHVISRNFLAPRINAWLDKMAETRPERAHVLHVVLDRNREIVFVLMAWITAAVMRSLTWPSRSNIINLVANLANAWVIVFIITRLVKNRLLRNFLNWSAWIYFALRIFGFDKRAFAMLESIKLPIGSVNITLLGVLTSAFILVSLLILAGWVSKFSHNRLEKVDDLSPSMRVLAEKVVTLLAYGFAVIFAVRSLGFDLSNLAILSGAIGVGLGFGLQKIVSNLVSGFILLIDKSIKPGDVISLEGTFGWIQNLSARYVSVLTRDGREFLIPNEDLITNQVVNWSHSNSMVRLDINFGVSYDSDPHVVRKLAREAAASVERVVTRNAPVCHITGFGDSSIDFVLRFWIDDPSSGLTNIRGNVFLALWDTLKENEIEIPFPRRDIQMIETKPETAKKPTKSKAS